MRDRKTSLPATIDAWRAALHPDDRDRVEANFARALEHGTPLANEDRIVLPSGEVRWVNALGRTTYDARPDERTIARSQGGFGLGLALVKGPVCPSPTRQLFRLAFL